MGKGRTDEPPPYKRLTVAHAADQLGITEGAVRSRIKRGTITTERVGGAVYVVLAAGEPSANQPPNTGEPTDEPRPDVDQRLVEAYEARLEDKDARIESLERQLQDETEARRRADHIIAALTERIPELEPAQEPPESPESASEGESSGEAAGEPTEAQGVFPDTGADDRRPWWRRLLGR